MQTSSASKLPFLLILAVSFVVTFWGFATPMFEFPDEQVHLETIEYVGEFGKVQVGNAQDVTLEMYKTQELLGTLRNDRGNNQYTYHPEHHMEYTDSLIGKYEQEIKDLNSTPNRNTYVRSEGARYPILYYLYSSLFLQPASNYDLIIRSFIVRLSAIPIIILMAVYSYKTGILLFRQTIYAKTLLTLTMLQPMYSFVSASVNSDNLHNLLFITLLYYSLLFIKQGFQLKTLLILISIVGLDLTTKPQGYLAIPIIILAVLISSVKHQYLNKLIYILPILTVVLYLTRNIWLGYVVVNNPHNAVFDEYLRFATNKLLTQNIVWYWGVFKWLGVVLPPIYWQVANRVVLLSLLGIPAYLYKTYRKKVTIVNIYNFLFLAGSAIVYAFAIFWADWQYHMTKGYSLGIQARYFFPTLITHMALLIVGIISLGYHEKSRRLFSKGLIILFLWLQLGGLWRLVSSYYDVSAIHTLITQLSQYKPDYLKGNWWYLWISSYVASLGYVLLNTLKRSQVSTTGLNIGSKRHGKARAKTV